MNYNHTPDTNEVRQHWTDIGFGGDGPSFDRWLAEELRQAKARALEEAAEAWDNGTVDYFEIKHSSDAPLGWSDESVADAVMSSGPVMDWLRKRAKQIKDNQ